MQPRRLITVPEVESIALGVFKENFIKLAGEASTIADIRASEFTHKAIAALAESAPESLGKVADPAFLQSLYVAQKQFAITGDSDLQSVLIQLLKSLSESKSRTLREICLSEAVERAGKITVAQLSILALIFVTTMVRWEAIYRNRDFPRFISEMIEPFCCPEAADSKNYSHLNSLGCLEIGPSPRDFEVFLMTHFRSMFSIGIPREDLVRSIEDGEQYLPLFEAFDGDESKLRFRFQTNETIEQAALALKLPPSWRATFQIDARYLMTTQEKIAFVNTLNPAIDRLRMTWTAPNSLLPRSSLTTTGIAIAHSYLASMKVAPASLEHWL